MQPRTACPACGSHKYFDFYHIEGVPVHVGFLWPSRQSARRAPTADIVLSFCTLCTYIWNRAFDPGKMSYGPEYEVSLHHSPTYQAFLEQQVARLTRQYMLHNKTVLEIGCGTGHFLEMMCRAGNNTGIGIDPCAPATYNGRARIRFLQEAYDERHKGVNGNFIGLRQIFHVIERPQAMLRVLRQNITPELSPVIYVEVPNGCYVIERIMQWMVFYEQVAYYTPASLTALFRRCGFRVLDLSPCYVDGQYLSLEATLGSSGIQAGTPTKIGQDQLVAFTLRASQCVARLRRKLTIYAEQGKIIVSWGSAGRGITFLNAVRPQIDYVVDVNPERQGYYIPVTGQQVISPSDLPQVNPDVIVLTNSTYASEIKQHVQRLGLEPDYISIDNGSATVGAVSVESATDVEMATVRNR